MKSLWLERILVYNPYYIALCLNEKEFKRACKDIKLSKKDIPEFSKGGDFARCHFFERGDEVLAIVCVNPGKHSIEEVHGILVHEAVHIWQNVKEYLEERNPSREFEAYSLQNICQNLFEAYRKRS